MRNAFGALGWTPEVFWTATLAEYTSALEGFNEANGGGSETKSDAPSDDELAALVAKYG